MVYWERIDATVNGLSRRKSPFARKRLQQFVSSYLFPLTCCGLESPKVLFFSCISLSLQVDVKNIIKSDFFWDNKKWFTYRIRKKTFEHFFFLCESDKHFKLVVLSSIIISCCELIKQLAEDFRKKSEVSKRMQPLIYAFIICDVISTFWFLLKYFDILFIT